MGCLQSRKEYGAKSTSISHGFPPPVTEEDGKENHQSDVAGTSVRGINLKVAIGAAVESSEFNTAYESLMQLESIQSSIILSNAVFALLDKTRELLVITDHNQVVQYMNSAMARVLNYTARDLVGQPVTNIQEGCEAQPNFRNPDRGFEWAGKLRWRGKLGDTVLLQCRVAPVAPLPGQPVYHLYLCETTTDSYLPRGSVPSLRKGSYDLKSIISEGSARRQSLAKLHNLPLEAPITKVLSLLCAAQENAPPHTVQMLEEVMDILRTTELYTSQLKTDSMRSEDPVTTNLIAALVAKGPPSAVMPRRSSNEAAGTSKKKPPKKSAPVSLRTSKELREALKKVTSWDFDVLLVEKMSSGKVLAQVGVKIFTSFDAPTILSVDDKTIYSWLLLMEANYISANSYHNSTHAADVLQAAAYFLLKLRPKKLLTPMEEICCLVAAVGHDLGHPGKSSAFLSNCGDALALLYNDISVLEQHHASLTFRLTVLDEAVNIFKGLDPAIYSTARNCIIDMILATDMFKHYEHYSKFVTVYSRGADDNQDRLNDREKKDMAELEEKSPEDIIVLKRMLIKCADVANPTRPLHLCKEWAKRIAEEYFCQTDEEKAKNLPVVMPHFDRNTCSIPVSQMGFMDYIVNNMFEEWDAFLEIPKTLYNLRRNYQYWKELQDKNCVGIDDEEPPKKNEQPPKKTEQPSKKDDQPLNPS